MPLEAGDDVAYDPAILGHHGAQLFGVELLRQRHRVDDVAKQNRQLAPLGLGDAQRRAAFTAKLLP
jgi:hypothetical protein